MSITVCRFSVHRTDVVLQLQNVMLQKVAAINIRQMLATIAKCNLARSFCNTTLDKCKTTTIKQHARKVFLYDYIWSM